MMRLIFAARSGNSIAGPTALAMTRPSPQVVDFQGNLTTANATCELKKSRAWRS